MSLWQRWWRQPQRVWLRRAMFQIHLWTGLALGLYIVLLSITGSVLVYRIELDRWAATPTPTFNPDLPLVEKAIITAAALHEYPGWTILRQGERISRRFPAIGMTLERNGEQIERIFDPYTGAHLGEAVTWGQLQVLKLAELHDDLLFGREGRWWNGIASGLVTVLVLTGLVVWWPGASRWKRSLGVKVSSGWRLFTWDLHSAMGFWLFGFLLIWGVSGMYLGVPDPFSWLNDMTRPEDGGESVGDVILLWMTRLHFGRWRDLPWLKAIWAVAGIVPAIMFVTGGVMWWNRVVRPRLRSRATVLETVRRDTRAKAPALRVEM
jgi:uncharacterized iron-regulated membrane protein